jgi:hypothetical protein
MKPIDKRGTADSSVGVWEVTAIRGGRVGAIFQGVGIAATDHQVTLVPELTSPDGNRASLLFESVPPAGFVPEGNANDLRFREC